jgi:polysaccharide biosynthesis transport protein
MAVMTIVRSLNILRRQEKVQMLGEEKTLPRMLLRTSDSGFAEAFRLLAINIEAWTANCGNFIVPVLSAFHGDGRSVVAMNLAIALSERRQVLIVPEKDWTHEIRVPAHMTASGNGVTTDARKRLISAAPNLWLLPAGDSVTDAEGNFNALIGEAADQGVIVIIDSPPLYGLSTSYVYAHRARQGLYVARGGKQNLSVHREVRDQLAQLRVKLIGIVTNEV